MNYPIIILRNAITKIDARLKQGFDKELVDKKKQIEATIALLECVGELNLSKKTKIIKLPDLKTGYSDFRIMNDCESEDRKLWIELIIDNEPVLLKHGDVLISNPPR